MDERLYKFDKYLNEKIGKVEEEYSENLEKLTQMSKEETSFQERLNFKNNFVSPLSEKILTLNSVKENFYEIFPELNKED